MMAGIFLPCGNVLILKESDHLNSYEFFSLDLQGEKDTNLALLVTS